MLLYKLLLIDKNVRLDHLRHDAMVVQFSKHFQLVPLSLEVLLQFQVEQYLVDVKLWQYVNYWSKIKLPCLLNLIECIGIYMFNTIHHFYVKYLDLSWIDYSNCSNSPIIHLWSNYAFEEGSHLGSYLSFDILVSSHLRKVMFHLVHWVV